MNEKIIKYDPKRDIIYCKDSSGYESLIVYDDKGNKIYIKDSYGEEWRKEDEYEK